MEVEFDNLDRLRGSFGKYPLFRSSDSRISQQGVPLQHGDVFDFASGSTLSSILTAPEMCIFLASAG
jgi:hypothetical protein